MEKSKVTYPEVRLVIRCKHEGYAFDLETEAYAGEIGDLIQNLISLRIEPGNSPYLWDGQSESRPRQVAKPAAEKQPAYSAPSSGPKPGGGATENQVRAIFGIARGVGFDDRGEILKYCVDLSGRELEKVDDLTRKEASNVISALREFE